MSSPGFDRPPRDQAASRGRNHPVSPGTPNGETAAMIDAEVNEGGPPSPVPCDTPVHRASVPQTPRVMGMMADTPPRIETCPAPDRVLHLPLGNTVAVARSVTLLRSAGLELIRLVIPAGKEIPPHRVPSEITVQCIEGHVAFRHEGRALDLRPGDLLHVCPYETHALKGVADSSVLVTRLRPRADELPETLAGT
jgi:quercetin dioxygenase-like cupin family protein